MAHTAQELACYEDERASVEEQLQAVREALQRASAELVVAHDARAALELQVRRAC